MPKTVWIIYPNYDYVRMFEERGWEVITNKPKALHNNLLIQFTGGSDVDPSIYGDNKHPKTFSDIDRDINEKGVFGFALSNEIPMAGICRGGQFLSAINGARLYQDVDGHAINGTHEVIDKWTRKTYSVTSTHHQQIKLNFHLEHILIAYAEKISSYKEFYPKSSPDKGIQRVTNDKIDVECLFYPKSKSLCFQPHPEFDNAEECRDMYFDYIKRYCFNGEEI